MNTSLIHCGPDYGDVVFKKHIGFDLGRLSIIDLFANANQTMGSFDKRFIIVFNREVFFCLVLKIFK